MFKFSNSFEPNPFVARTASVLAGAALIAGLGLLAGCPSQSTEQAASAPPPVAQAAGFHGSVYGGRQPIVGATVVVYGADAAAGGEPQELAHTSTDSHGRFTVPFTSVPTGQLIYVVAKGGDAGTGSINSAIRLMTVAGIYCDSNLAGCNFPASVNVNELTTVASTAALKDYLQFVDCTTIAGNTQTGTCASLPGATDLARMASTVDNLVDVASGRPSSFLASYAQAAGAPLRATLEKLDTLADILAACVNATGPGPDACTALFAHTGNPSNTLQAAWHIAAFPSVNAKGLALYQLMPTHEVFQPVLTSAPPATSVGFWTVGGDHYAFVTNAASYTVSEYTARSNGTLSTMGQVAAENPYAVAVDATGRYFYEVDNSGGGTLRAYEIGSDGKLSQISSVSTNGSPTAVAVDPVEPYVYVTAIGTENFIREYKVGSDGTLSSIGSIEIDYGIEQGIAVGPAGHYLYATNSGSALVQAYKINSDGTLSANGEFNCNGATLAVAVDPTGRYVYVVRPFENKVAKFKIDSDGQLSDLGIVTTGQLPVAVAVDPTGRYVYVANQSGNSVSAYTIGADGALTPNGAAVATNGAPGSVTVDPTGRFVYVANLYGVSTYMIGASGGLTPVGPLVPFPNPGSSSDSDSVVADPSGRYVYAATQDIDNLFEYRISSVGGLQPSGNAPTGKVPQSIVMGPRGRCVYVGNGGTHEGVSEYVVGSGGALSRIGTIGQSSVGATTTMVVDPAGSQVFVEGNSNGLHTFAIEPDCTLTQTSANGGITTSGMAADPTGQYLYMVVSSYPDGALQTWQINSDGSVSNMLGQLTINGNLSPSGPIVDPTGRYVYIGCSVLCGNHDDDVRSYKIGSNGTLSEIGSTDAFNGKAVAFAADPAPPYYVYGVIQDSPSGDFVCLYQVSSNGSLNRSVCQSAGSDPDGIAVDPTGNRVYVVNKGDDTLFVYKIDPSHGGSIFKIEQFPTGEHPYAIVAGP